MTKLHTCAKCQQPRITNDFNHRADGSRYPNCVYCGNKPPKKTRPESTPRYTQMQECICCGIVKGLCRDFVLQRDPVTRARVGYTADCRQCRTENDVRRVRMKELGKARWADRQITEPVKIEPKPITHSWETLGLEWSGRKAYDPYANANRYEGGRT